MKIYTENPHDEESIDQNSIDPIAELLHQASATERNEVGLRSDEFARRLTAKIEDALIAVGSRPVRLASYDVDVARETPRKRLVALAVAAATVAAALLLFGSLFTANHTPKNQSVRVPSDSVELKETMEEAPVDILHAADAERGLLLVNASLGQTIQSVGSARSALRDLLRPLRSITQQQPDAPMVRQQASNSLGVADDHLVASFTAKVLGL